MTAVHADRPPAITVTVHDDHPRPHPCLLGHHAWAWLTRGGIACYVCGVRR